MEFGDDNNILSLVASELRQPGAAGNDRGWTLRPLGRDPERRDHAERRAFGVWNGADPICHVLVGPNLGSVARKARAFHEACPEISAEVLFFRSAPDADILGTRYIDGRALDDPAMPETEVQTAARSILAALEQSAQPSTHEALAEEWREFCAETASCPLFSAIDRVFLDDVIFPWMRIEAGLEPCRTRWTNGDFVSHNLIIDRQGRPWLVDYEYARRTHFAREDFIRWRTYSEVGRSAFDPEMQDFPPWLEVYFLLRQTVLESQVANGAVTADGSRQRASRMVHLAASADRSGFGSSVFLKTLTLHGEEAWLHMEAELVKRGEWGMRLKAEVASLEAEVVKRTEWAQRLGRENEAAARHIQELGRALEERNTQVARWEENFRTVETQLADAQRAITRIAAEVEAIMADKDAVAHTLSEAYEINRRASEEHSRQHDSLENKIRRMQASFSWRVTALFRAVRRAFFDSRKR